MERDDKLGPRAMSKRTKAKGLQKLRWYCQTCEKQCRDENGFNCHCTSEGHHRKMHLFGENPEKMIQDYSQRFEDDFLLHLKQSHGFSRVAATLAYNEFISDRDHVHMNSTRWQSLTKFVEYLGQTGKCRVDCTTDKDWFIRYNNNNNNNNNNGLFQGRTKRSLSKSKLRDEDKQEREITKQIQRASSSVAMVEDPNKKMRVDDDDCESPNKKMRVDDDDDCESPNKKKIAFALSCTRLERSKGVFEDVTNKKEPRSSSSYWVCEGIVVKVISKVWAEKGFYNKKGVVTKVLIDKHNNCIAQIKIDDRILLQIHQDHLQTVLPHIGGLVRILNGPYRGFNATLVAVDTSNFCAKVQLLHKTLVLSHVAYEDICKLAV